MAIELNGHKIYGVTVEQVELIKANYLLKAKEIGDLINLDPKRVAEVIKALELRKKYTKTKIPLDQLPEWETDLHNPKLSHAFLGLKWGITPEAIGHARKTRGLGVWRTNQNTVPELKVQKILERLDIAFVPQKRIAQWSIDLYLGHKICIDINGTFFHLKLTVQEKDQRKAKWLYDHKYFYLTLSEEELINEDLVQNKLENFYWASLKSNLQKNNFVNPITQGCSSIEELTVNSRVDNTVPSQDYLEGVETNCKSEDELPIEARNS